MIRKFDIPAGVPKRRRPVRATLGEPVTMPKDLAGTPYARPVSKPTGKPRAARTSRPARAPFPIRSLAPAVAGLLLVAVLAHSAAYLNRAKDASGIVLGAATSAYEELDAANRSLNERDFGSAADSFNSAQTSLLAAQDELDNFRALLAVAPPARSADSVLTGAYFLAEAGKNLVQAMRLFDDLSVDRTGITAEDYSGRLRENRDLLANSLMMVGYAEGNFAAADGLPGAYSERLDAAMAQVRMLKSVLRDLVGLEDLFLSFFGDKPRTYLLVFQNYDEMRATGGFIGTYGTLKYDDGRIDKLQIRSVYSLDGSLTKRIAAPGPFQPDIPKWGMRDANWFADFPTSARKLLEFYEYGSETADGVLAMTPHVFVRLLELVGPIEMPAYGVTLDPSNFQDVVQHQTSYAYDRELNQPKKFLDDFTPVLLDRMSGLKKEEWFRVFAILQEAFLQKHMMAYSTEPATQAKLAEMGFDGRLLQTEGDYLSVINSNHGGTKTDLDVRQAIDVRSVVAKDGTITNTVTVKRNNPSGLDNLSFMRILVPQGSALVSSDGFLDRPQLPSSADGYATDPSLAAWDRAVGHGPVSARTESGKTAFSGWVLAQAGREATVTVTYTLPFRLDFGLFGLSRPHSLLFQKQSGSVQSQVTGLIVAGGRDISWHSANASVEGNAMVFSSDGRTDSLWGMEVRR